MNEPPLFLSAVSTSNVKPRPEESASVILWAIVVHWWAWCREQAKAGWMFTLIVLGTLFLVYALRLEAQSGELLRQCVGVQ